MDLRLITPSDLSELIEVRAATRENPFSRAALRAQGITEESLATLLATTHRGWLAEANGRITGFAIGDGSTGELWVIAVLPNHEGHGIGSALLQLVEDWLWSKHCPQLWLTTSPDPTTRAFTFYLKHGWVTSRIEDGRLWLIKSRPN